MLRQTEISMVTGHIEGKRHAAIPRHPHPQTFTQSPKPAPGHQENLPRREQEKVKETNNPRGGLGQPGRLGRRGRGLQPEECEGESWKHHGQGRQHTRAADWLRETHDMCAHKVEQGIKRAA